MSLNVANNPQSVRRRASFMSKTRPRTSADDQSPNLRPHHFNAPLWASGGDGNYTAPSRHVIHEPVAPDCRYGAAAVERDMLDSFSPNGGTHRQSKSISCIRYGVGELRAAVRRFSFTIRHKSHRHTLEVPLVGGQGDDRIKGNGVFRNHSMHRKSFSSFYTLHRSPSNPPNTPLPISPRSPELPIFSEEILGGEAARAAAATQNELIKLERVSSNADSVDFNASLGSTNKPSLDSESGIEINIQDIGRCSDDLDVVRKDPVSCLPTELMCSILSFLDAESLKNAELVSQAWYIQASSRHVWRDVFRHQYKRHSRTTNDNGRKAMSTGLGKVRPNQDWKKMYAVRLALERRWTEGKAAAIYLHGHKDSVYCVQFDENKIITGSRDRTIRIWDAHYPWPCLKVIGAIHDRNESPHIGPLPITPQPDAPGSTPFISICPPVKPASELMKQNPEPQDFHRASILCLQFDDEIMVTGSSDFTCIIWDINDDYRPIRRLEGHRAGVLDVCFDSRYIVSCSKDTTICVWDRHTGELIKKLIGHRGPVNAVQLRGDLIVSASGDGIAKLWNITSGLCIKEFTSRDRGLACVEFSEDARTILAGGNDQVIYQFDANTGELVNELKGHTNLVRSLHMDNENGRVISGSYDMSVKVFDGKSGDLSIDLPGWTTSWMLSAKSDYRRIVATSQDSRAVIMDFGYGLDGIDLLEE
ncbi:hypothetical protein LOZ53_006463 [Ophidiomyces ophidiicola]|nr:hypothetical protein LOZ55_006118 [Ophidiomyces ophidiicola]KAI1981457.1 hypothetical protein LOZ53_006463 [Ophidiomyces ophidiicola]KAI1985977.1 hypothetical protein LOZ54_004048 [Ophidiomyces ophidiicola]KAI1992789.1 hypothetical protein LOZ51_004102 [Ophidiomyces ophidiicola]